jgi:hypothetical protein
LRVTRRGTSRSGIPLFWAAPPTFCYEHPSQLSLAGSCITEHKSDTVIWNIGDLSPRGHSLRTYHVHRARILANKRAGGRTRTLRSRAAGLPRDGEVSSQPGLSQQCRRWALGWEMTSVGGTPTPKRTGAGAGGAARRRSSGHGPQHRATRMSVLRFDGIPGPGRAGSAGSGPGRIRSGSFASRDSKQCSWPSAMRKCGSGRLREAFLVLTDGGVDHVPGAACGTQMLPQ